MQMIKYLPGFGCEPIVLTVENETTSMRDESLLEQINPALKIYKSKSFEPFDLYKKFTGKNKHDKYIESEAISLNNESLTHRLSIWIRMNLFIPDARIGWYFSALKKAEKIYTKENFGSIITIGPPHSTHLIGMNLSKTFNVPHIPVLIDPWVDIIYYKNFKRSKTTLMIDNHLEKKVLEHASQIIFVTETTRADYSTKYSFVKNKSEVLYWGYNEDDFSNLIYREKKEEVLLHAGNIFDFQNPGNFWATIKKQIDGGRKLKLKFIGTVSPVIKKAIADAGLEPRTEYLGFLKYKEMLTELINADYLLVCATEPRHVPGKLFEYLRSGKQIIAFGNENNEVKQIIEKANAGMMFNYSESAEEFFNKKNDFRTDIDFVKTFDRKKTAERLTHILKSI
ncbi:MAG: hypothetical protein IPH11_13270 [Ignavibacteriales bacterium]|nr:hypothetical protein [Ignavibacteriales bacterium]